MPKATRSTQTASAANPHRTERFSPDTSASKPRRSPKELTLLEKFEFISQYLAEQEHNPYASHASISKMLGIPPAKAAYILKEEDKIRQAMATLPLSATKMIARTRQRPMAIVEEALFAWYKQQDDLGMEVSSRSIALTSKAYH